MAKGLKPLLLKTASRAKRHRFSYMFCVSAARLKGRYLPRS